MSDQVFAFEDHSVRTVIDEAGVIWWVARDVCAALGISYYRDAISGLQEDERGSVLVDTLGGRQKMAAVNEPGLYRLIFASRKPAAERFKRWLAHEVLPALRRTGQYKLHDDPVAPDQLPSQPQGYALPQDAEVWLALVREARRTNGSAAARRIWRDSPLPSAPISQTVIEVNELGSSVGDFIKKCCVKTGDRSDFTRFSDLRDQYFSEAPKHGWYDAGLREFALELRRQAPGRVAKSGGHSGYRGVVLEQ